MSNEEKYKKAINELADSYELHLKQWAKKCIDTINEYTTNLQQENKQLKSILTDLFDYGTKIIGTPIKIHITSYEMILDEVQELKEKNNENRRL